MVHKSVHAAAINAAVFLLAVASIAHAQQAQVLPQALRDDPYVTELNKMLGEWNAKTLRLPAKDTLVGRLKARVGEVLLQKAYTYQTATWQEQMLKQVAELPEVLEPRKGISGSGAMVLRLLFMKGLNEFKRRIVVGQVRSQLELPMFLILGSAQAIDRPQIDAEAVAQSTARWWTAVWPFCD